MRRAVILAAAVAVAVSGVTAEARPASPAGRGHKVAASPCGACHAVEPGKTSAQPRAPTFASVEMQHTAGLEGRLASLTRDGHYGMPAVALTPAEVDDILAYIDSLHRR